MKAIGRFATGTALLAWAVVAVAQTQQAEPDPATFRDPPPDARPATLYFWMNGNVTREGIDADLAAIRDAGLGGVMMFDGSSDVPKGPVDYLSPQWLKLMRHMIDKGAEHGLKVGLHNAPGWSSSGGPWIAPAQAMQQIVWSETTVESGAARVRRLPQPYTKLGYYRDARVLAYPASIGDDAPYRDAVATMRAGRAAVEVGALTDRDLHTSQLVSRAAPLVVAMKAPFAVQSVTLFAEKEAPGFSATIEASQDGKAWSRVAKVSIGTERGIEAPGTANFPAVTARYFRITPTTSVKLAEALFHATPRIVEWDLKGEFDTQRELLAPPSADVVAADAIDPAKVIDITDKVDASGMLRWTPPAGRWTILRFGHTPTGKLNVAASDSGRGLEVDKLSAAAVDHQYDRTIARVIEAAGPHAGKTFDMVEIDSYEAGLQNWTATLPADFRTRNGYDLTPYLPALTGRVVGDRDVSDRFLFDFRRTLSGLMAQNYYGRIQERAAESRLRLHVEGYGPGPYDTLQVSGRATVPMTEFWTRTPWTDNRSVKMVTSAAHVYGKNVVAVEAFTGEAQTSRWQDYPYAMKALGDLMFAQGVNQIFFHRFAHQPNPNAAPGMAMGPWGVHLDRTNTWFGQSQPWMTYLARSQHLLRQGIYVADILYFTGEQSPNQPEYIRPDVTPDTNPLIGNTFEPVVPAGYSYDFVDAEVLLTRASVKDGHILLPNGASYRLIALPRNIEGMTPQLAAKLRELVEAGAVVVGPRPPHPMTMAGKDRDDASFRASIDALWGEGGGVRQVGKGRVFTGGSIVDALADMKLRPDASCATATPDGQVAWHHRRIGTRDMYFVANRQRRNERVTCTFRVGDTAPELWDAEDGSIRPAALFRSDADTTTVSFDLAPSGSTFVMLGKAAGAKGVAWVAHDGVRVADVAADKPAVAPAPADSFTISLWAKPDIDLRLMPDEAVKGRINETGKNYLIPARSGRDIHGAGSAVAGLALGRNGAFVIERESPDSVPAVLVSDQPVAGWTHVALVYDRGVPSLYLNGKLARTGLRSGRKVYAGGGDPPFPTGVTYFFEGNSTPTMTLPRAMTAAEIAAQAAAGPPAPELASTPIELTRGVRGKLSGLAWQSGRYTISDGRAVAVTVPEPRSVDGPWTVRFQPGRGAPASIELPQLQSLSRHADAGVRHFSGTATYERSIDVPADLIGKGKRLFLDLGRVEVLAGVTVNGRDLGVVWKEPYRVDITDVVKPGANQVTLKVANLWANRMIGDAALPEEGEFVDGEWPVGEQVSADGKRTPIMARKITALPQWYREGRPKPPGGRVAFTPWTFYQANEPLLDSGVLGPVRLVPAREVELRGKGR